MRVGGQEAPAQQALLGGRPPSWLPQRQHQPTRPPAAGLLRASNPRVGAPLAWLRDVAVDRMRMTEDQAHELMAKWRWAGCA